MDNIVLIDKQMYMKYLERTKGNEQTEPWTIVYNTYEKTLMRLIQHVKISKERKFFTK
jgi:hypothetical protein